MNKVFLKGRTTKDVEVKHSANGFAIANFSIATDESYKDKNGTWQKETEYHNCVAFGKLAEKLASVGKGENLVVIGKIKTDSWEKDGKKNYSTKIYADHVEGWVSQKIGSANQQSVINQDFQPQASVSFSTNEIPF